MFSLQGRGNKTPLFSIQPSFRKVFLVPSLQALHKANREQHVKLCHRVQLPALSTIPQLPVLVNPSAKYSSLEGLVWVSKQQLLTVATKCCQFALPPHIKSPNSHACYLSTASRLPYTFPSVNALPSSVDSRNLSLGNTLFSCTD